jgi:hypothetical protein
MVRKMRLAALTATLLVSALVAGQVDEESMLLGSLKLNLGTSEKAIRANLPKNYTLELNAPTPGSEVITGLVFSKPGRKVDDLLGDVRFQRGRLISASKDSGLGDRDEGVELARKLYSLLYGLTGEQKRSCMIHAWQSQNIVNAQVKGITVQCGNRYVELHVIHPDEGRASAGIREGLE